MNVYWVVIMWFLWRFYHTNHTIVRYSSNQTVKSRINQLHPQWYYGDLWVNCFWLILFFFDTFGWYFFGGHKSFLLRHWYPFLDFWWCLLWVSKPEREAIYAIGRGLCTMCSLRFISGATPADLLVFGWYLSLCYKGPLTLSVSVNALVFLAISFQLNLFIFLNKLRESLQKWVATSIDQICCKGWCWPRPESISLGTFIACNAMSWPLGVALCV